jgi:hypothetical protein
MALPTLPTKTNADAGGDDPKQALLADLAGVIDWAIALQGVLGNLVEEDIGEGLESDAGALRVKLAATSYLVRDANGLKLDVARATGNAILGTRWRDMPRQQKVATYTVATSDAGTMIVFNSASAVNANMPALAGTNVDGMIVGIKNVGAGTVTIDGNAAETIGGQSTLDVVTGGIVVLRADLTAVDWDIMGGGAGNAFAAGVRMLFQQTSAPVGWTKQTDASIDNSALRFVTGTASNGGTDGFTTTFGVGKATQGRTLTTAQLAGHAHNVSGNEDTTGSTGVSFRSNDLTSTRGSSTAGSNAAHDHDLDLDVKYTDAIVAQKD